MSNVRDAVATMGTILPDDVGGRDAVHVAVIAVTAGRALEPGQDVGVSPDGTATTDDKHVGIVDPFLKSPVLPGQRFWLYLYPRTITGLRHSWTHPAFVDEPKVSMGPPAESEAWLRRYADELGDRYENLMEGADDWVRSGEYYYGPETHGYHGAFEGVSLHPDFWSHYERVRGVVVPEDSREHFFTCSC